MFGARLKSFPTNLFEVLGVELVGGGQVDPVLCFRDFESALPEPGSLVEPIEKVVPAALPVKTHRIVQQSQLRRHLFTIIKRHP